MSASVIWLVVAAFCLVMAGAFAVFVPKADKINAATGVPFLIARWGHSLVWVLLAVSFALRASQSGLGGLSDPIALLGGLAYVVFISTYLRLTRA